MDPTTQAHIDPNTLHASTTTTASGDIPSLHAGTTGSTARTSATSTGTAKSNPTVTGLRQRVNSLGNQIDKATDHPAVKNVKGQANRQIAQFREFLGKSPLVLRAEKRAGVDRVVLVVGGALLYLLLIPLNFLHLAQPTTTLLTFIPPMLLSARVLDQPNEQRTKLLLSYFVVFGFVQFAESLMAGFLARRIPQYYTVKLVFLAYLIHPRTKGALKIYEAVLRPALTMTASNQNSARNTTTPPTSKPSTSSSNSPTIPSFGSAADRVNHNTTVPAQTGAGGINAPSIAHSTGGSTTLPSGGGTGVGLEVEKDRPVVPAVAEFNSTFGESLGAGNSGLGGDGNVTKGAAAGEHFSVVSEAH